MENSERLPAKNPDLFNREIAALNIKILENAKSWGVHPDQLLQWLEGLAKSPFGRELLQNKQIDGSWFRFSQHPRHPFEEFIFGELPVFKAMQEFHHVGAELLEKKLREGTVLGIAPGCYCSEWKSSISRRAVIIEGVDSLSDNPFLLDDSIDILIARQFLYGLEEAPDLLSYYYSILNPGGIILMGEWTTPRLAEQGDVLQDTLFQELLGMKKRRCYKPEDVDMRLRIAGFDQIKLIKDESGMAIFKAKKIVGGQSPLKFKRALMHTPRQKKRKTAPCTKIMLAPA